MNAAAQRPQIFKRRTGIHFHGIAFAADGIAGKRRLGKKVIVHIGMIMVAHGMAALLIGTAEIASEKFDTISRPARYTLLADAAMPVAEHHMVARLQSPHFRAHGLHNAGAFVPQHGRQGHGVILVAHNQIGVAHAGGHDFHQHFIPLRPADFEGCQHKICAFARGDGGVDFALESTGRPEVLKHGVDALGTLGKIAVVGAPALGTTAQFDVNDLLLGGKTIVGVVEGSSVPKVFIPELVDLFMQGKFPFDKLIKFYDFKDINQAAIDSQKGITLKPVIKIADSHSDQ